MKQKIREDLVQGIVDDAVARVSNDEFSADDMDEAVDAVIASADAFEEDLTDEEIQEAANRILKEFS